MTVSKQIHLFSIKGMSQYYYMYYYKFLIRLHVAFSGQGNLCYIKDLNAFLQMIINQ